MKNCATDVWGRGGLFARGLVLSLVVLFAAPVTGCGRDYTSRLSDVFGLLEAGDPAAAVAALDELIDRGFAGKKPESRNVPLLMLERASIFQGSGDHAAAARDFNEADQMLELLDLTPQGMSGVAEYLWSGSAKNYRTPVYEKLMVNISSLASYLALGDVRSANVEARRIAVLLEYFESSGYEAHPMMATAGYLAGLAAELGGQHSNARRFYTDALAIAELPGLARSLEQLGQPRENPEIIAITFVGTGPRRKAEHLPVGLVLGWLNDDFALTGEETELVGRFSAEELLTWVNFPVLEVPESGFQRSHLVIGEDIVTIPLVGDVAGLAIAQFEADRPAIAWGAITRALTRITIREGLQGVGRAVSNAGDDEEEEDGDIDGGDVVGGLFQLAGLFAQAAMQIADVPDTRGWSTIPASVNIVRQSTSAGPARVSLVADGPAGTVERVYDVNVPESGAVVLSARFLE